MVAHNFKNLVGQKFGALSPVRVLPPDERPRPNKTYWECLCDCGKTTVVPGGDLQQGKVKSCGCRIATRQTPEEKQRRKEELRPRVRERYRRWYAANRATGKPEHGNGFKDLTGQVYGRLTVLRQSDQKLYPRSKRATWECACECGNTKIADAGDLHSGRVKSCGCLANPLRDMVPEERKEQDRRKTVANMRRWRGIWANHKRCQRAGITVAIYRQMLEAQGGVCVICQQPNRNQKNEECPLAIDHDHACCTKIPYCGKCVRGLLCNQCNFMLGVAHDSVEVLQAAIDYLKKWQTKPAEVA